MKKQNFINLCILHKYNIIKISSSSQQQKRKKKNYPRNKRKKFKKIYDDDNSILNINTSPMIPQYKNLVIPHGISNQKPYPSNSSSSSSSLISSHKVLITPLYYAITQNDFNLLRFLVRYYGVSVNISDNDTQSPLFIAIKRNCNIEILRLLIYSGADLNTGDLESGETPLMALCQKFQHVTRFDVVTNIILHKLNRIELNKRDKSGLTALHYAIYNKNIRHVKFFIWRGCFYDRMLIDIAHQCNNNDRDDYSDYKLNNYFRTGRSRVREDMELYQYFVNIVKNLYIDNKEEGGGGYCDDPGMILTLSLSVILFSMSLSSVNVKNRCLEIGRRCGESNIKQIDFLIAKDGANKYGSSSNLYNFEYHSRLEYIINNNNNNNDNNFLDIISHQINRVYLCEMCCFCSSKYKYSYIFIKQVATLSKLFYKYGMIEKSMDLFIYILDCLCNLNNDNARWSTWVLYTILKRKYDDKSKLLSCVNKQLLKPNNCFKFATVGEYKCLLHMYLYLVYSQLNVMTFETKKDITTILNNNNLTILGKRDDDSGDSILHFLILRRWEIYHSDFKFDIRGLLTDFDNDVEQEDREKIYPLLKFFIWDCGVNVDKCINAKKENLLHYAIVKRRSNFLTKVLIQEFDIHTDIKANASANFCCYWCKNNGRNNEFVDCSNFFDIMFYGGVEGCFRRNNDDYDVFDLETIQIFNNHNTSLKCLASRCIRRCNVNYKAYNLPKVLEQFVDLH